MDGYIHIAVGESANTRVWKNKKVLWSDFKKKLSQATKTRETYKEFLAASKADQSSIKDVGGYVGGYLRGGKRSPHNVVNRQVITLDLDFANVDFWEDFCMLFDNEAVLHGTHKHSKADPRYRLVLPLSREVSPDEYVAISRQIAGMLGIDLFDNTTFETNRLMFWPSTPCDMDYYYTSQEGDWLDADGVLATYKDWRDISLWPTAKSKIEDINKAYKKQEDPEIKKGIVGAFCRTFGVEEAIESFLSGEYAKNGDGRYSYLKGSTAGGLIVYDNKFAYSHHGSDPCSGILANSFDLVRIHLFSHLDSELARGGVKTKSYLAMEEMARNHPGVKKTLATESILQAKFDFAEDEVDYEDDINWMVDLEVDSKGAYLSNSVNINLILAKDPRLKGAFRFNEFASKHYICQTLPWRRVTEQEPIRNVDVAGLRNYIESVYRISGPLKIKDSLDLEFQKNAFNPVTEYLKSLKWDKKKRIDTLLIEYFGATDNAYTREALRKMLVGAVARAMKPGCKFDYVLVLAGPEGSNKSTFLKKLGKSWFSDTFTTVHGREAFEQLQGAWIIEMAELAGLRKAEVETIKHFITKQEDDYRPAYGTVMENYKRKCVFFATTNTTDFLRDPSGNRRFLPIDVNPAKTTKSVWNDLDGELDQIWAEAVSLYKRKEPLILSPEAEEIAKKERVNHSQVDERRGVVEAYLNRKLPAKWDSFDISERLGFLESKDKGTVPRQYVCIAEIWCEGLGKRKEDMTRYNTRDLNDIMRSLPEWQWLPSPRNFKLYGKQKYYKIG